MKLEKEIGQKKFRNDSHKLGVNLVYSFSWFQNSFAALIKPFGITSQQFNVLRILRGQHPKPASIKLIRERMLDKMSDASRIVEKLRMKGYVDRKICPKDRRSCEVLITDKGMKILSKIDKEDNSIDNLFYRLNQTEIRQINLLLDKLRGG